MIIDAHAHIVVAEATRPDASGESWRPVLERGPEGSVLYHDGRRLTSAIGEFVDPDRMRAQAAAQGVDHLLLSPWVRLLPFDREPGEALGICRTQNEALAALVAADPGHVSALGAVPLQDPALAARELCLARDMGLAGVEVSASVAGTYLGDDRFEPFWGTAEDTGSVVFVHPTTRGLSLPVFDEFYLWNSVANPVETAIAGSHLVLSGVLERHPRLTIVLAHGGGALWSVRGRLRRAYQQQPSARSRLHESPDDSLARLYFDTVTHDPALLARLVEDAGPDHVLLGSDRPFDMGSDDPVGEVRGLGLAPEQESMVLGGNAARLIGRDATTGTAGPAAGSDETPGGRA
ncbi:MAG TPA: amidohydrolase family protein [Acidimicrobiales bacterium]|nr:amidohydrolase family protein [Acidimicrobiales bacterium]